MHTKTLLAATLAASLLTLGAGVQAQGYDYRGGDLDRDGVSNRYDRDRDGDGIPNRRDPQPDQYTNVRVASAAPQADLDGDGIPNFRDGDRDGDGVRNERDRYPDHGLRH